MTNTEKLLALIANQLQLQNSVLLSGRSDEINAQLEDQNFGLTSLMKELTAEDKENKDAKPWNA